MAARSQRTLAALAGTISLCLCACALAFAFPAPARAATGDPLAYWGGPVAHSMTGVVVDWGPSVNSIYTDESTGDPGLVKYFAAASGSTDDLGGLLAQYMDSSGHNAANSVSYGGQYEITPSASAYGATITDSEIQTELANQIEAGHLPPPGADGLSTIYLLLFPAGKTICMNGSCSGTEFCAYHGDTRLPGGTPALYAVLPDNTGGGMASGCGNASTALQNETSYTSHEWSETITDPLVAEAGSDGPPLAWYDDNNCDSNNTGCGEVGDKCNQVQAGNGGWTVQEEWSNLDAACEAGEPSYLTPTASFTAPAQAPAGQAAGFDGSSSSDPPGNRASASYGGLDYSIPAGIESYSWDWGDGTAPGGGATAAHAFSRAGTYLVSLTVTDALGFSSTVTRQLAVSGAVGGPVARPKPAALTGSTSSLARDREKVSGMVDPHGLRTSYHVEYGTTRAYGHSSASVSAGTGMRPVAVALTLAGLRARTRYHYRLIASSAGGTVAGADRTFTTGAHLGRAPRLRFSVPRGQSLHHALARRLLVAFSCSSACTVRFELMIALHGITRLMAIPLTVGRGSATLRSAGAGVATVTFGALARRQFSRLGSLKLVLSGLASGGGGAAGAPGSQTVVLSG
ncbi:MAG: PKD domain-containing protein [Solirubrobacterales bacterium]|nr:PKD domain-containing protein [Solirubrobacterales bacterium]